MRIKIGDTWYTETPEQPIMVELTDADKSNIASMPPGRTKYAVFDDDLTDEQRLDWMKT